MSNAIGDPTIWKCRRADCGYEASSMTYGRFGPVRAPDTCPNCGNDVKQVNDE